MAVLLAGCIPHIHTLIRQTCLQTYLWWKGGRTARRMDTKKDEMDLLM